MADANPYPTPAGVENAIKDAAKKAAAFNPALDVNKRIHLEYFNRFLSREFSEGPASEWVLKGGTGILARVPSTRSTRDIDLYRSGFTITEALSDLIRLASISGTTSGSSTPGTPSRSAPRDPALHRGLPSEVHHPHRRSLQGHTPG